VKLRDGVGVFLVALRADGVKPETVALYEHRLSRFLSLYGDKDIRKIDLDDVRSYVVQVGELDYAPHTQYTLVRVVRRLFKWLYEERRINSDFHKRIRLPKLPQGKPKAIEMQEVMALLEGCDGTAAGVRDRAVMLFLLDTGCRVGGLCGLRVADVDLRHKRADLFEKGGKAGMVLFGDRTGRALRGWLKVRPFPENEYVFTSLREDRGMNGNTVIQMLRRRARRAGVAGRVNPHAFRHAFAREYILNGGDLASVSEMMGHTQIIVTKQFYAVFQAEELRQKHDAFSPVSHLPGRTRRRHN
jgi:site-specific recombinase XerD